MNKFFKKIEEYKIDIIFIVALLMALISSFLVRNLNNLDEVWVFNTARNISNGLLPYKDFNLVTTPRTSNYMWYFFKNIWYRNDCNESSCSDFMYSYNVYVL